MNFGLTEEQQMIVDTVRSFVEQEIYPHEELVEKTGEVPDEIAKGIEQKCIDSGFFAANLPEEVGGGGLNQLDFTLLERELGRGSMALTHFFGRPSGILMAGNDEQKEKYLLPAVRGERHDALAMTEPNAGSDVRGMQCQARQDGDDWVVNGTKHFISHANVADFVIVFIATGVEETPRGQKKLISCFLVDRGTPGFEILPGYESVSHRGYKNCILSFKALPYAAEREQFGQPIGKFQGVSFQLADLITQIDAADWLTLSAAWRLDQGLPANREIASAKLHATETLAKVTDTAIQIFGGMGLMSDLPLERFLRDARVERIWDGTSEIQRHIISRELLRPLGA